MSSLRTAFFYENFIFTQENVFAERCTFLYFRLKESSENMIYLWNGNIRKLTKIWSISVLFKNIRQMKIIFFFQCISACNTYQHVISIHFLLSRKCKSPLDMRIQLYIRDIGIRWLVENCKIVFSIAFRCFIEFSLGKFGMKIQKNFGNLLIY